MSLRSRLKKFKREKRSPEILAEMNFGLMEAVLILATIAQTYELTLVPEYKIVPQPSITLRPEHSIQVTIKSRL